jgi:hypothetical protein
VSATAAEVTSYQASGLNKEPMSYHRHIAMQLARGGLNATPMAAAGISDSRLSSYSEPLGQAKRVLELRWERRAAR